MVGIAATVVGLPLFSLPSIIRVGPAGATFRIGVMPALYATARGHRFTRGQYLTVAVAPAVTISLLGFVACFSQWGGYLILPLAFHLGGCVGDGFAARRVLGEPRGTEFEDLRDGIRFHRMRA